jgi:hypothetical protein
MTSGRLGRFRECAHCKMPFLVRSHNQRYCCKWHREIAERKKKVRERRVAREEAKGDI